MPIPLSRIRADCYVSKQFPKVFQLKSYPSEISPVARHDTIRHVERSAAESKYLTQSQWLDHYVLGLL